LANLELNTTVLKDLAAVTSLQREIDQIDLLLEKGRIGGLEFVRLRLTGLVPTFDGHQEWQFAVYAAKDGDQLIVLSAYAPKSPGANDDFKLAENAILTLTVK
jgi:hypothetical protein